MTLYVKEPKIVITLFKRFRQGCMYPCIIGFTVLSKTSKDTHYMHPNNKEDLIGDYLSMFRDLMKSDGLGHTYKLNKTTEKLELTDMSYTDSKKFWIGMVLKGWIRINPDEL